MSKQFCSMRGDTIEVLSEAGLGSTFFVRLPVGIVGPTVLSLVWKRPESHEHGKLQAQSSKTKPCHVLVIDDVPAVCAPVRHHLEHEGYPVTCARDGEEGLRLAQAALPDLITLDVCF